jgi:hypothetical protein
VLYHADCVDGFGGAWCFWKACQGQVDLVPCAHQTPAPDVRGRHVFLVDFSYKRAVVSQMLQEAASVTLVDHHLSALQDLAELPGLQSYTSLDKSGAILAYEFCFGKQHPAPMLLQYIQDRDLWTHALPDCKEILFWLYTQERSFELWDSWMSWQKADFAAIIPLGKLLIQSQAQAIHTLIRLALRTCVLEGYTVPLLNCPPSYVSEAGALLSQGQPFAACYYDSAQARHFSLRSQTQGLNVAEIAMAYGGGGHPQAAGFNVPREHPLGQI